LTRVRPLPLPPRFTGAPFAAADARAAGVSDGRLSGRRLTIPTRGVRSADAAAAVGDRAAAFMLALPPDVAFSHLTAAQLWGLPLTRSLESAPGLHLIRRSHLPQIRREGCHGHRGLQSRALWRLDDLPVVGREDTWCDLGELGGSVLTVDDLIVLGDTVVTRLDTEAAAPEWADEESCARSAARLVRAAPWQAAQSLRSGQPESGLTGRDLLAACLTSRVRPRGKVRLEEALGLVRSGVRSPMETRSRIMFHRAGFPEPLVNEVIRDDAGGFLLEGDLVWRDQKVIGEYQGEHHASIHRRSSDSSRASVAEDFGWTVLEIYAADVFNRPRRIACLQRFARALDLDPATLRVE